MGKMIDLTNQRFGRLVVLERDFDYPQIHQLKNKNAYWKCQCDCGNITTVDGCRLRKGATRSCGCFQKESIANKTKKDLVGQVFGRLTVVKDSGKRKENRIIWTCKCECGNICEVSTNSLTRGNTASCGCLQKEMVSSLNRKDLTNQRFGMLTALSPLSERKDNKIVWLCRCDCGTECKVTSSRLINGHTQSCGCLKSKGELEIAQILIENNIEYEKEKKFEDLGLYRYDFYLPQYNRLIEFDGEQHFKQVKNWGNLASQKERDALKTEYAISHQIELVRIPYWERGHINIEKLLGNKYLITKKE